MIHDDVSYIVVLFPPGKKTISTSYMHSFHQVPFPRLHFFMPGFAPLVPRGGAQYRWHIDFNDYLLLQKFSILRVP